MQSIAPQPQLLSVPLASLTPFDRNSRTHNAAQLQQLCDSIEEFGFTSPILVDENMVVLAGHGRLEAAKKLAMATVPILQVKHLTSDQKRAYVIADNKIPLNAGWNQDVLVAELMDLAGADFNLEVTGFDFRELDAMDVFSGVQPDLGIGLVEINSDSSKSKPRQVGAQLQFNSYRLPMSNEEVEALEAALKKYEEMYGLHQGFVGWLTDGKA